MRFSVGTLKGRAAIGTPGSIRKSYMLGEKRKDCYSCKTETKAEIHNDKKKIVLQEDVGEIRPLKKMNIRVRHLEVDQSRSLP